MPIIPFSRDNSRAHGSLSSLLQVSSLPGSKTRPTLAVLNSVPPRLARRNTPESRHDRPIPVNAKPASSGVGIFRFPRAPRTRHAELGQRAPWHQHLPLKPSDGCPTKARAAISTDVSAPTPWQIQYLQPHKHDEPEPTAE